MLKGTVKRKVLLPDLDAGWDEQVADEDRSLVREVLSCIRELARFKQPRAPLEEGTSRVSAAAAAASSGSLNLGDTSMLRNFFGAAAPDADLDEDGDRDGDRDRDRDDDSIQYVVSYNNEGQYYIVNTLLPLDTVLTVDRLALIVGLAQTLIMPNSIDIGIDLPTSRLFLNVRVNKHNNIRNFVSRMIIIEQLGAGPALRTTGGLPLAAGVAVRRTANGTVINEDGNPRPSKRARSSAQNG
jgi:hypothetical protein